MADDKNLTEEEQREKLLNELKEEWPIENDVQFNEFTIAEKLQNNAFILSKYQNQLAREKNIYSKMLDIKDKIIGEQYDYYRFEDDRGLQKPEIEKYYLPRDKRVLSINRILRMQELRLNYFDMCCKALSALNWNMKNFIEANRLF